ncbi:uncharacterized protein L201_005216 [Kwoniella dendrophila CBS 6074]|uniref:N-acetyltransferase domain-containing protein n=1 Tax=Kwoniella dendrophila CBS 6074 TaxID=1295534 RepID=A0AAX4K0J3_9TREE
MSQSKIVRQSPVQSGLDGPYLLLSNSDYRLTLWKDDDVQEAIDLWNHPEVGRWACFRSYPYTTQAYKWISNIIPSQLNSAETFLSNNPEEVLENLKKCDLFPLSALRDKNTGKVIGFCNIGYKAPEDDKPQGTWEIAYDIHPNLQGKGIGRKLIIALLDFARYAGIKEIIAYVEVLNIPSTTFLQKLGFVYFEEKTQKWPDNKGGGERIIRGYAKTL